MPCIQFKPFSSDSCLFLREGNGHKNSVASYVDDFFYRRDDIIFYKKFEKKLSREFLISEVDDTNWFLGMQIRREKGRLEISQGNNVKNVLEHFGTMRKDFSQLLLKSNKSVSQTVLAMAVKNKKETKNCNFYEVIRFLKLLSKTTRPDKIFVVRSLNRFVQNPGRRHLLHILRCLKATK